MMKEEAPEMASRLEAQLLVKHLQEDIGARTSFNFKEPKQLSPSPAPFNPPHSAIITDGSAVPPRPSPTLSATTPVTAVSNPRLTGVVLSVLSAVATSCRWRGQHWSEEEIAKRQQQRAEGKDVHVPKEGLRRKDGSWTPTGVKVMDEVRNQLLSSEQLAFVKHNYPQLHSIDQGDWSMARTFLASKLHGILAGRWEARYQQQYKGYGGSPAPGATAPEGEMHELFQVETFFFVGPQACLSAF